MTGSVERTASTAAPRVAGERAGAPEPSPSDAPGRASEVGPTGRGRCPDFFIVGHPKCGTTALYEMLRRHPRIFMPDLKEPTFFAEELPPIAHRALLPATLPDYLALFAPAGRDQLVGEASATYLWSHSAARAIAAAQPRARAIALLREPASLLRSLHLQNLQSGYESEPDLRRALALEPRRRAGELVPPGCLRPQALLYSQYTRFAAQLRRLHGALSRERVLVLIYEDFRADNAATARTVLRFLGIDDGVQLEAVEANPTVRVRARRLDDLLHAVSMGGGPVSGAVKASLKRVSSRRARRTALALVRRRALSVPPPPPDERLMLELRRCFRGEVEAVSEYLGRDLVGEWGYDRLG
ncbi:MAG TPA: sulfotransferase [Solirubrobacteraceae bacterium]|jgi:hypothetical protein|nr:sulfotransferase [Solirubrobacteraceae bacterium]